MKWEPMETAPTDGRRILAREGKRVRVTWFGKTSHVPLYGWCVMPHQFDFENVDLWEPTHWRPTDEAKGSTP